MSEAQLEVKLGPIGTTIVSFLQAVGVIEKSDGVSGDTVPARRKTQVLDFGGSKVEHVVCEFVGRSMVLNTNWIGHVRKMRSLTNIHTAKMVRYEGG